MKCKWLKNKPEKENKDKKMNKLECNRNSGK